MPLRLERCPQCPVARAGTNIRPAITTRKHCAREGTEVACASVRPAETFMRACCRPTEAARFRVQKCANNLQLIIAGDEWLLGHAYAARFRLT